MYHYGLDFHSSTSYTRLLTIDSVVILSMDPMVWRQTNNYWVAPRINPNFHLFLFDWRSEMTIQPWSKEPQTYSPSTWREQTSFYHRFPQVWYHRFWRGSNNQVYDQLILGNISHHLWDWAYEICEYAGSFRLMCNSFHTHYKVDSVYF